MLNLKILFLSCLLGPVAGVFAQQEGGAYDTRQTAEDSMRSRSYSQDRVQNWDARLKRVSGSVSLKARASDEWSQVTEEIPLVSGDSVRTGSDGTAELYIDDKGAFQLGRNTELDVPSIDQSDMSLSLKFGSLVAKVKHLLSDKYKMQVHTPSAVCAIRGTEFAVEYSRLNKETGVAVFDEGRLAVTPLDEAGAPGTEQLLEKNTELSIAPAQKRFRAVPLSRMIRYRSQFTGLRATVQLRGKVWKRISSDARAEMRESALKGRVIRRQLGNAKTRDVKKAKAKTGARKARAVRGGGRKKQEQ